MATKYDPCEHFHKYNRLEGRPRETELDDALAAKIHDPLWMLARQYQFGEFQGEDAGSAIFAKVAMNSVRLSGYRNPKIALEPIDENLPLETVVEKLKPPFDNKIALRLGNKFLALLAEAGSSLPSWPLDNYKQQLIERFPFQIPTLDPSLPPGQLAVNAKNKTLRESVLFLKAIAGKAINGNSLWGFFNNNPLSHSDLINTAANPAGFIDPAHQPALMTAFNQWKEWILKNWNIPADENNKAWVQQKMEYDFDVSVDESQNQISLLHADGYHHGHLDWFSFDVGETKRPVKPGEPVLSNEISREIKSLIPTQASFQGMPNARWWELEDSRVDPGNIKANDTDVVAVLISQFALQYSNDWLMIPYDVPVGSMAEVEGIVVTDTFGDKTFVEPAHKHYQNSWKEWSMYSLTVRANGTNAPGIEQRLFIPPAAVKVIQSEPVEQIKFIRDEMANMVWGIERIVPDGMGSGTDGYECATGMEALYRQMIESQSPIVEDEIPVETGASPEPHVAKTTGPQLKYTLGNTVTENWIPFIPVHINGSNREIQLQRASMPRVTEVKPPHQIRPRTLMLREGIDDMDNQSYPFFIFEEEVPRAGATVIGNFQRTRWYNGKVVTWFGRQKSTGRGEGSSGLRFDFISDNF